MIATVAICTWNRATLLDQTLARLHQLIPPRDHGFEIIVVNNNCTDGTDDVVSRHEAHLPIRLLHESTPGKVNALNRAIREAVGEYILFTDDDALVEPDWLVNTLNCFDRTSADMGFGRVMPWWETAAPKWYDQRLAANFALLDYGPEPFVATSTARSPFGVNYSFRRSVFDEIGMYKTDLGPRGGTGFGGEDDEIFRRMLRHGKTVQYDPTCVVRHYVPALRCRKSYHRMRSWRGSQDHLQLLRDEAANEPHLPRLFGIPRYVARIHLGYAPKYLKALLAFDRPGAFHAELKLIRTLGLAWNLLVRRPPPAPVSSPSPVHALANTP